MIAPKFDSYLKALCETPLSEHTEHTGRTALETLLIAVADDLQFIFCGVENEILAALD